MTRLFLTTALTLGLALPAFAVQPATDEKLAQDQSYTFWLADAIRTLDPHKSNDAEGADVLRQLFEGLMNEDPKGAPVPGVAASYDLSDDRLTYTFHLRPEAKWSNGDPVTAEDFVYGWRRLANPETASEYSWFMELMHVANAADVIKGAKKPGELGVKALDARTLEVRLSTPTPYFVKMLGRAPTFPLPRKVVEAKGDAWTQPGNLIGNGAYMLKSHDLGVRITMEKSPNYWDAANVVMQRIQGLTVSDADAALARFQAGDLDRAQIPTGEYPRLAKEFPDQAISVPYACTYAYIFNLSDKGPEALKDVRVRKALSYAMQRETVVNQILQGGQKPAYSWTHWAIEGFGMPQIDYASWSQAERLEKARALLAEAGYGPGKPLKLTLTYNRSEDHRKIAVAAQQFYKALGVQITLNDVDWKVHAERLRNQDFQMARYTWCADYNEASTFLDYFQTDGLNYGKYSDPEFDRLMAESRTSKDPGVQYTAAEKILAGDMPLIPIYHYAKVDMINPAIKGLPTENVMNAWYAKNIYRIQE
ncbi:MAG: peptide ABC transporter substrate-binding protein [Paracoccus sp. (in: a-proteobacteria)]|uniref:peptide ABC transporter substrate-binding protein n=1 Tax=Paracoccus sp. TaxID=267 RepID=UPI0039E49383